MGKRALITILVITAITVSLAAYYRSTEKEEGPQLLTAAATQGSVVQTVTATGTLQAVTTVQVGSQVSGTIKALHADFNSNVKKGQVIAELDPALMQAQVDQASATVQRLQADLDAAKVKVSDTEIKAKRAQQLSAQQLIPAQDLDTAQSDYRSAQAAEKSAEAEIVQARAALKQNKVNLDHTIITAPIDGTVISRSVDVGQTVAASLQAPTLFTIANDLSHMQVNASIDESDIGRIKQGQAVTFQVDAYPNEQFSGTVTQVRLNPVVDQNVTSYVTVIDVPNPNLKLKPGMTATVNVSTARADDVMRVPTAALRFEPTDDVFKELQEKAPSLPPVKKAAGEGRVWLLAENRLEPITVKTGISDGKSTAVTEGPLPEGAQVVTGVITKQQAAQQSSSPFMPNLGRGGFGGGSGQRAGAGGGGGGATQGARGR